MLNLNNDTNKLITILSNNLTQQNANNSLFMCIYMLYVYLERGHSSDKIRETDLLIIRKENFKNRLERTITLQAGSAHIFRLNWLH